VENPDYFDRLGARLEAEWGAVNRDEEAFPDLAAAALADLPPGDHLDVESLIDRLLDPDRPASRSFAPLGAFGQPGLTAWFGHGFVVEIYFWRHSLSAIHNHPFCGAFTILEGFSVHAKYDFEEEERLGARARIGRIGVGSIDLVGPGHVERFSHQRHPLVHVLLHVPIPSVSMVIRTIRTVGYLRYFPPTVALAMDEPDEAIGRPLMLLDTLRTGGDPAYSGRLEWFLGKADFETTFRALSRIWGSADSDEREALIEVAARRHGGRVDAIARALDAAIRAAEIDGLRAQLTATDDRLVATGLMVAETREQLLSLFAERHANPADELRRFTDEVCSEAKTLIPEAREG
jgi:hypothetical protein